MATIPKVFSNEYLSIVALKITIIVISKFDFKRLFLDVTKIDNLKEIYK